MKYILDFLIPYLTFILELIWTFSFKKAIKEFNAWKP